MNEENEVVDVVVDERSDVLENDAPAPVTEKKVKKHAEAQRLVEQAKHIVKEADEQTQACRLLLVGDLKEYEDAKDSLKRGGLDVCTTLIEQLGYKTNVEDEKEEEKIVVFEPKEELEPIVLKNVQSGKFTGVIYSLLGGAVTAVGLVYLATEKLGMTLDISKVPSSETFGNVVSWFSTAIGLESNVYIGSGIFSTAVLAVTALIYLIRVKLKENKNLNFAVKQLVEAEIYTEEKGHCKEEMDKVDVHMKKTVDTLKMYEVLFNEQKGKLERIQHIEGTKAKSTEYHEKSFLEIRETKELIRTIKDFIATPMSDEGKLSEKSVLFLNRAKTQMDKMLERLY